jgi:PEGA domain-containing protein
LPSRNNEMIIKREGFVEEEINLHDYSTHRITIRLNLLKDRDYRSPERPKQSRPTKPPRPPRDTREPEPKPPIEKPRPKPLPEATEFEHDSVKPVDITLRVVPVEAAIYLDGRFWGLAPKSGIIENIRLKAGKYVLSVVKPGYKDYKKIVYVTDVKVDLTIKLEKK